MCVSCIFFFFSSRRRHTRSLRDWSSDVCSSDLPNNEVTFERSKLVWSEAGNPGHREWSELYRECLGIRKVHIAPRLRGVTPSGSFEVESDELMYARWTLGDGSHLQLAANFSAHRSHPILQQVG